MFLFNSVFSQKAMNIEKQQINSFFKKIIKKLYKYLNGISVKKIDADHPRLKDVCIVYL